MTDGLEVKQNGEVFEARCHRCGVRWRTDEGGWLGNLVEHAVQHFKEPPNVTAAPQATKT